MAVLGLHQHGASREFLSIKQPTHLPVVKPTSSSKHENHPFATALPKRQSKTLLQSLKPFFRHSVTIQFLKDKSTADEQCFKLVRDYDGGLITTVDPRRLYRRYEHTVAYNRINLSRRTFPYINDRPPTDRQSSPSKGLVSRSNTDTNSHPILTHFVNFCTVENNVCDLTEADQQERAKLISPSRQTKGKSSLKTVEIDNPSFSDLSALTISNERLSASPTDLRRLKIPSLPRDHETIYNRVRPSYSNDEMSVSPECMSPQIIKINPRIKEPAVRKHVTKKECKRRNKSHVVCAPPPSPAMSKYTTTLSQYGAYLKPKSVPFGLE